MRIEVNKLGGSQERSFWFQNAEVLKSCPFWGGVGGSKAKLLWWIKHCGLRGLRAWMGALRGEDEPARDRQRTHLEMKLSDRRKS